ATSFLSCASLVCAADPFLITPAEVSLKGNFAQTQLLISAASAESNPSLAEDFTGKAIYTSANEQIVIVTAQGRLLPRGDGGTQIKLTVGDTVRSVKITVTDVVSAPSVDYLDQVRPVLYKAGCNMGACHAAQHGQGGFKLSVFGFDPGADRTSIA